MASHCFEGVGRPDHAWAAGLRAVHIGEAMDADARRASTLPYVGQALLRLADGPSYRHLGGRVRGKMDELLVLLLRRHQK